MRMPNNNPNRVKNNGTKQLMTSILQNNNTFHKVNLESYFRAMQSPSTYTSPMVHFNDPTPFLRVY